MNPVEANNKLRTCSKTFEVMTIFVFMKLVTSDFYIQINY